MRVALREFDRDISRPATVTVAVSVTLTVRILFSSSCRSVALNDGSAAAVTGGCGEGDV